MKRLSFAMILLLAACGSSEPAETEEPTTETDSGGEAEAETAETAETGHTHGRHDHGHHGQGHDHDFSDVGRFAAIFDDPERDEWQKPDEVVALMALEPGQTVADLGAGTGYFLSRLAAAVGPEGRVLGLDVETNMVAHMEERIARESLSNVEARVVPTDDPALEPASVDAILIVDTWHHIGEREAYSAKLFAALKPGGSVFVVDFTRSAPHGPPAEMRLTPLVVAEELSSAGFEIQTLAETLPHQYMVEASKPVRAGQ